MALLEQSQTYKNLKTAFASEAQAHRRYLYFARQADIHGYPDVAGLFRDTAEGEANHANGHLDLMLHVGDPATGKPIGTVSENLESAIAGELAEAQLVYPRMAETARAEGFGEIAEWFEVLAKAEHHHAERFHRGLEAAMARR